MKIIRFVSLFIALAALAALAPAQDGQNQPIYDPNDPVGRVLPPNLHFLIDTSGSMSCAPNGASGGQCFNYDLLGWNASSKIYITKRAITGLMSRNTIRARWSLWIYCNTSSNRVSYRSIAGNYSASGKPTTALYRTTSPTYDTWVFAQNNCTSGTNRDRMLTSIYHVPGTTTDVDPDPEQWFKSSVDAGYDNRPDIRNWCDRVWARTPPAAVTCGTTGTPFLTEFDAYGNTPIGYSMQSMLMYVKAKNLYGATQLPYCYNIATDSMYSFNPTEDKIDRYAECRENDVLLLTDGVSNCGTGPTTAAATLWNTHKMKTFVVGFGMQSAGDKANLNTIAVSGGTNQAYFADNEAQLLEALMNAIGQTGTEISGDTEPILGFVPPDARTWPATMPAKVLMQNVVFKAGTTFAPTFSGHLRAFQALKVNAADPDNKIDFLTDFSRNSPYKLWDAADELLADISADPEARKVYFTDAGNNVVEFTTTKRSQIRSVTGLNSLTNTQMDAFINYVRRMPLGPVTYCTPVFIGPPNPDAFSTAEYQTWAKSSTLKNRCPMILLGANDGMIHCFSAVTGKEIWALIPYAFIKGDAVKTPKLYRELYGSGDFALQGQPDVYGARIYNRRPHYYYVASPLKAATLRKNTTSDPWRTYCVFGLGGGGEEYYCLDVTSAIGSIGSPSSGSLPTVPWRFSGSVSKPCGETWSVPAIGQFGPPISGYPHGRWGMVVGSGFDLTPPAEAGKGKTLWFVDMDTGATLKQWDLNDGSTTLFGADATSLVSAVGNCLFAPPVMFESPSDNDSFVDAIYFGDYKGHLYKIKVDAANPANSTFGLFFTNKNGTPIYCNPDVAEFSVTGVGKRTLVTFSEYGAPVDLDAAPTVYSSRLAGVYYCLVDENCGNGNVLAGELAVSSGTSSSFSLTGTGKGFYFEMPSSREGESTFFRPTIFAQQVGSQVKFWMAGTSYKFFPNATPGITCDPVNHTVGGGKSSAYVFNLYNGAYFPSGQPTDLGIGGVFYGRASAFHKGARGEGWVDVGTGDMKGFGYSSTSGSFSEFGAGNVTYDMNPVNAAQLLNQYWRELH